MPTRRAVWRLLLAAVVGSAKLVGLTAAVPSTAEHGTVPAEDVAAAVQDRSAADGDTALAVEDTALAADAIRHGSDDASPLPRSQDMRRVLSLAAVLLVASLLVLAVRTRHAPPPTVAGAAAALPRVPGRRAPPLALPR